MTTTFRKIELPACGTIVKVVPVGCDEQPELWWEAVLVDFGPRGFRVRSTRPGSITVQTVFDIRVPEEAQS